MSSWLSRRAQNPLTAALSRLFEHQLKGVPGDVELVSLQQSLVVRLADRQKCAGVDPAGVPWCRRGYARTATRSPAKLGQRFVEVPAVGRRDDIDRLGEEAHERGGRAALDDLLGSRLSLAEQVVGDRQPKKQLVCLLSIFCWLPCRELGEPLETLFFELKKLAVVFFVDRLDARSAAARTMTLGLGCSCSSCFGVSARPGGRLRNQRARQLATTEKTHAVGSGPKSSYVAPSVPRFESILFDRIEYCELAPSSRVHRLEDRTLGKLE